MRTPLRAALLGLAIAGTLGLAACGSDGGDDVSVGTGTGTGTGTGGSDLCDYARELENTNIEAAGSLSEEDFDTFDEIIANVKERAPEAIAEDVETLSNGFSELRAVFAEYDYDVAKVGAAVAADPELQAKLDAIGGEEVEAASGRIDDYFEQECGVGGES